MTKEDAVKILKYEMQTHIASEVELHIAMRMAIEALSAEPQWIPCSEGLPEYNDTSEYLVTDKGGRVRHCCLDPYMPESFVTVEEGMIVDAVTWMPLPEPYEGGEQDG